METITLLEKLEKIEDYIRTGKPDCEGNVFKESDLIAVDDLLDQVISHWEF